MRRWFSSKKQEISETIKDNDLYYEAVEKAVASVVEKAEFLIMLQTPSEFKLDEKPAELPHNVELLMKAPSYFEGEEDQADE